MNLRLESLQSAPARVPRAADPAKILIVRLGALGDLVHGVPVAAALRTRFPDAQIDWLVDRRHAAFLDLVPAVSRVLPVDGRSGASLLAILGELRRERYDAAVDLQGLIKSASIVRLCGARRVIGFSGAHVREAPAAWFYGERRDVSASRHVVDKNLALLGAFGIDARARRFPLVVPVSPAAADVQRQAERAGSRGVALVNPGAAWPNKRWPAERFGEVSSVIASRHRLLPVVLWGPGEAGLAAAVVAASAGAAVAAPPTRVADVLALAHAARLVVSGDTGPLHLAGAMGAPIVAIFGPTDPARNGPWDPADACLSRFGDCVCHYQRRCRRRRACIEDISVEDVRGAIDRRLAIAADRA